MKIAVSACVKTILQKGQPVYLEAIGTLIPNLKSSSKSSKSERSTSNKVNPLSLSKKKNENKKLIKLLCKEYKIKKRKAKSAVDAFTKDINYNLQKYNLATIPDTVILSKSGKGKYFLFSLLKKSDVVLKKPKIKKPSAKAVLVNDEHSVTDKNSSVPKQIINEESEIIKSTEREINYGDISSKNALEELITLEKLGDDLPEEDNFKNILKDHFYQESETEIQENILSKVEPNSKTQNLAVHKYSSIQKNISNHLPKIIAGVATALIIVALVFVFRQNDIESGKKGIGNINNEQPVEKIGEQIPPNSEDKGIDYNLASLPSIEKPGLINVSDKCIIITGSFSDPNNERRMKNTIVNYGYDFYSETNNGVVRVGLQFECADKDLLTYLHDVRGNINSKAWYLYPPQKNL